MNKKRNAIYQAFTDRPRVKKVKKVKKAKEPIVVVVVKKIQLPDKKVIEKKIVMPKLKTKKIKKVIKERSIYDEIQNNEKFNKESKSIQVIQKKVEQKF